MGPFTCWTFFSQPRFHSTCASVCPSKATSCGHCMREALRTRFFSTPERLSHEEKASWPLQSPHILVPTVLVTSSGELPWSHPVWVRCPSPPQKKLVSYLGHQIGIKLDLSVSSTEFCEGPDLMYPFQHDIIRPSRVAGTY